MWVFSAFVDPRRSKVFPFLCYLQFRSIQFGSEMIYKYALGKPIIYALHPHFQKFFVCFFVFVVVFSCVFFFLSPTLNSSNIGLIDDGPFLSFQRRSSSASSFCGLSPPDDRSCDVPGFVPETVMCTVVCCWLGSRRTTLGYKLLHVVTNYCMGYGFQIGEIVHERIQDFLFFLKLCSHPLE